MILIRVSLIGFFDTQIYNIIVNRKVVSIFEYIYQFVTTT